MHADRNNWPDLSFQHSRIMGKGKRCGHSRGTHRRLGTTVPVLYAGCNKSLGAEGSAMAMGGPAMAMARAALVALEEPALGLAPHHCTMAQGHWHQRFRCRFRSLQRTGGTNRCSHRRSHRSLPRICSNLQRQVVLAQAMVELDQAMVALDHHWR